MNKAKLKAPFPYFGGKSTVASLVWSRLGDVPNYVEPFFGSGAMLLARPTRPKIEAVNDADHFVSNFWRSIKLSPEATAEAADWPVNETDLEARHYWLVTEGKDRLATIMGDPDGHDPKVAGYWAWGMCAWIGGGFCSGTGPWRWNGEAWEKGEGVGVNRKLPHLGDAGRGINRQRPHLGDAGRGAHILEQFLELSARLRDVRVCSGDWARVTGPTPTTHNGQTGVFLDPPYGDTRKGDLYRTDSLSVYGEVTEWCLANGDNPGLRIALCGYDGEHELPGWECIKWKAKGGYGSQGETTGRDNATRERIWFSPHCINPKKRLL